MTLAKAKLASSITFIVLASFTSVTYDRQNMFIIQATGLENHSGRRQPCQQILYHVGSGDKRSSLFSYGKFYSTGPWECTVKPSRIVIS
jgi:hypothetical protein